MCGIMGFVGSQPDRETVIELARLAGRRGPHGCGWALSLPTGKFEITRSVGASLKQRADMIKPAMIIIGHSRLATAGGNSYALEADLQPLSLGPDGPVLAHNGVARVNYVGPLDTGCDSERLLRLSVPHGLGGALSMLPPGEPYAVLYATAYRMRAARHGLPLYMRRNRGGTYFCSVEFAGSCPVPEDEIVTVKSPRSAS